MVQAAAAAQVPKGAVVRMKAVVIVGNGKNRNKSSNNVNVFNIECSDSNNVGTLEALNPFFFFLNLQCDTCVGRSRPSSRKNGGKFWRRAAPSMWHQTKDSASNGPTCQG